MPGPASSQYAPIRTLLATGFGYILTAPIPLILKEQNTLAPDDALAQLERQLTNLITRYEQYFIGMEKREPLQLLAEVEKLVRRHAGTTINNTMLRHRFTMLTARLNTYREHWNRILRLMEEGRYSRDRFISDLRKRQRDSGAPAREQREQPSRDADIDRLFNELREARMTCHMPVESLTREMVAASIAKSKPALIARLGTDDLHFRVVVENGKPKIKAGTRK